MAKVMLYLAFVIYCDQQANPNGEIITDCKVDESLDDDQLIVKTQADESTLISYDGMQNERLSSMEVNPMLFPVNILDTMM
ncbi:hypothetical protein ACH3XW_2930 [Acanthocheilonema viteae]